MVGPSHTVSEPNTYTATYGTKYTASYLYKHIFIELEVITKQFQISILVMRLYTNLSETSKNHWFHKNNL